MTENSGGSPRCEYASTECTLSALTPTLSRRAARFRKETYVSATLDSAVVADLAGQLSGSVLRPEDAGYDAARAVHNGSSTAAGAHRPLPDADDVAAALAFARAAGLEVAIRGGGHNVAGRAVTDDGLMIDLAG